MEPGSLSSNRTFDAKAVSGPRFALLLAVLLAVMFFPVLIGSKSFFLRDYGAMGLPVAYHHQQQWNAGSIPLWNPLSNCGAPFTAQWGTMVLYPLSLFYVLLPLPWSLNVFAIAHLFLGGLGMFCLVRAWTRHGPSSALAGIAYVFSGTSLACLAWANYSAAFAWIPWMFWITQRAWREGGRWIAVAIWLGAMQMLTGVPELILFTWFSIVLLFAYENLRDLKVQSSSKLRSAGRLGVVVGGIALLCVVQLWPFLELLRNSQRAGDFKQADWSTPLWGWASFLVPLFRTHAGQPGSPHFQPGQYFLTSYYVGIIPVALVVWGLFKHRVRRVTFLAALSIVCVWISMGSDALLLDWVGKLIPGLQMVRYPVKFLLITAFLIPLVAGLVLPKILEEVESARGSSERSGATGLLPKGLGYVALVVVGVVVAITLWSRQAFREEVSWDWVSVNAVERLAILGAFLGLVVFWRTRASRHPVHGMATLMALSLLLFVDGWTHNRELNPVMDASAFTPGVWKVSNKDKEQPKLGESRVFIIPAAEEELTMRRVEQNESRFLGRHLALWSHLNLLEGIPKFNGASTLRMGRQMDLESAIYSQSLSNITGLLNFLAVSYRTSSTNLLEWVHRPNPQPWIHAGVPPRFAPADQTASRVLAKEFDPRREVWVEDVWQSKLGDLKATQTVVETKSYAAEKIEVAIRAEAPTLMTVAQSYSPNWIVEVDGQPGELIPVNHAFQGVLVPAGDHRVTLRYVDRAFQIGSWISMISLVATVLWFIRCTRSTPVETKPAWSASLEIPSKPRAVEPESSSPGPKFQP